MNEKDNTENVQSVINGGSRSQKWWVMLVIVLLVGIVLGVILTLVFLPTPWGVPDTLLATLEALD